MAEVTRDLAGGHQFREGRRGAVEKPLVVGPNLPTGFATAAACGDFATGLLAILALLTAKVRPLFWFFVVSFNLVGIADFIADYAHAIQGGLPAQAGALGAAYAIPVLYVPLLIRSCTCPC